MIEKNGICSRNVVKIFFGIIIGTFSIGLILLLASGAVLYKIHEYEYIIQNDLCRPICYPLVLGATMVSCTVFLMIFGSTILKNRKNMFMKFFVILELLFFISMTIFCIQLYLKSEETPSILKNQLIKSMPKYMDGKEQIVSSWDKINNKFKCCGVFTYKDWSNYTDFKETLPKSCCLPNLNDAMTPCLTTSKDKREYGCLLSFTLHINSYVNTLLIISIISFLIQIILLFITFKSAQYICQCDLWQKTEPNNELKPLNK